MEPSGDQQSLPPSSVEDPVALFLSTKAATVKTYIFAEDARDAAIKSSRATLLRRYCLRMTIDTSDSILSINLITQFRQCSSPNSIVLMTVLHSQIRNCSIPAGCLTVHLVLAIGAKDGHSIDLGRVFAGYLGIEEVEMETKVNDEIVGAVAS